MRKKSFLPASYKHFVIWLQNFARKLIDHAATLDVDTATTDQVTNDTYLCSYALQLIEIFKQELSERVKFRKLLYKGSENLNLDYPVMPVIPVLPGPPVPKAGVVNRVATIAKTIKLHPNYTEAIGEDLGIIGAEVVVDFRKKKPIITNVISESNMIIIDWTKARMQGVIIYSNAEITGDADNIKWVEISRDLKSPYEDTRKNKGNDPETRYYKLRYMHDDKPVGKDSRILKVVAEIY